MAKGGNRIPLVDHWNGDPLVGFVETETVGANSQGMDENGLLHWFFDDSSHFSSAVLSRFYPRGACDEDRE